MSLTVIQPKFMKHSKSSKMLEIIDLTEFQSRILSLVSNLPIYPILEALLQNFFNRLLLHFTEIETMSKKIESLYSNIEYMKDVTIKMENELKRMKNNEKNIQNQLAYMEGQVERRTKEMSTQREGKGGDSYLFYDSMFC